MKMVTQWVVIIVTILLIVFDVAVFVMDGTEATISYLIATYSLKQPMIPFAFGVLCGHFFWQMKGVKK